MRLPIVDYEYGDPDHPDRVTRAISGPPYTPEDHALLAGLRHYKSTLCPGGCGQPIDHAWHSDMDGWYDGADSSFVCYACSARDGRERTFPGPVTTSRDFTANPLPPFTAGKATSSPTARPSAGRPLDATLEGGGQ